MEKQGLCCFEFVSLKNFCSLLRGRCDMRIVMAQDPIDSLYFLPFPLNFLPSNASETLYQKRNSLFVLRGRTRV